MSRSARVRSRAQRGIVVACLAALVVGSGGCGRRQQLAATAPAPLTKQPAVKSAASAKANAEPVQETKPKVGIVQSGITMAWFDAEKRQTRMSAKVKKFTGSENTQKGVFTDFSGELYENGKPATRMTAPKVVVDAVDRTITATGGVVIRSLDRGTVVKSSRAKWYSRQGKIVGDGGVEWTSDMGKNAQFTGRAPAFETDTALQTITAMDSVKGLE